MAQSPDTRISQVPTETANRPEDEHKPGPAATTTSSAEKSAASAGSSAARRGGETMQEVTQNMGDTTRQTAAASAEMSHEAIERGTATARRAADILAEGHQRLLTDTAEHFERIGQRMAEAVQDTASELRVLLPTQGFSTQSLQNMQENVQCLVSGVVDSNLRATRRLLQLADPGAMFDLQRRFMREYLNTMMQGASLFVNASRQAVDDTLRPIEDRIQERLQANSGRESDQGDRLGGHEADRRKVAEVMTAEVRIVSPDDTILHATRMMRDGDTEVLPVSENDRLIGVVTDRDVAVRLVADGKDPARTKVREVMSDENKYVYEDEELGRVADNLTRQRVRRLPVVNHNKRIVGVVSMGDITRRGREERRPAASPTGTRAEKRPIPTAAE